MLSFPEMDSTSSLPFGQLGYVLHLLLSPVGLRQVSPVHLILACTVVKSASFVILHPQDPSLQCSPLSRNRNATVIGYRTSRKFWWNSALLTSSVIVCLVIFSHESFLDLIRICQKIPVKLNSFGLEIFRNCFRTFFGLNDFGLITCGSGCLREIATLSEIVAV